MFAQKKRFSIFSQRGGKGQIHRQKAFWYYGGIHVEYHRDLWKIFYDSWCPKDKAFASTDKDKEMARAVHIHHKNFLKTHTGPHLEVTQVLFRIYSVLNI